MEAKTPLKAIRMKCRECATTYRAIEVCSTKSCPLWAFRMGKNPYRAKREYTEKERAAIAERMNKAREAKKR